MSANAAAKRIDDTPSPSAALSPIMRADQEARKQYNDLMARRMGMRPRGQYNNLNKLNARTPVATPKLAIPPSIVMPANMFTVDKEHNPTQPHYGNHSSMKSPSMVPLGAPELKGLGAQTSFRDPISKKDIPYSAPGQTLAVGLNAAATLIPNPKDMAKLTSKTSSTPTQTGQQPQTSPGILKTHMATMRQSTSLRGAMSMGGLMNRARKWGVQDFDYAAAF
jgi:hypothetical protein